MPRSMRGAVAQQVRLGIVGRRFIAPPEGGRVRGRRRGAMNPRPAPDEQLLAGRDIHLQDGGQSGRLSTRGCGGMLLLAPELAFRRRRR